METNKSRKRNSSENKRNSGENKRNSGEKKQDELSSKYFIEYLMSEQRQRDHEIAKLKKLVQSLKKRLETYTHFFKREHGI